MATSSCSADIILISESWLQSNVFSSELFPSHYKTFRRDRDLSLGKSGGGGLLAAFSDWIKVVRLQDYEVSSILCETLLLKISYSLSIFYLCLVYLPPPVSINSLKNLFQSLEKCPNINNENLILIGDLNISQCSDTSFNFSSGNSVTRSIYPLLSLYNLKSYNNVKNHFGKTLDLVLCNFLFPPNISVTRTNPLSIGDKYHPPLQIKINFKQTKTSSPTVASDLALPNLSTRYNFKKANLPVVYEKIQNIDWSLLFNINSPEDTLFSFTINYTLFLNSMYLKSQLYLNLNRPFLNFQCGGHVMLLNFTNKKRD